MIFQIIEVHTSETHTSLPHRNTEPPLDAVR
jgi:hypothetical protein